MIVLTYETKRMKSGIRQSTLDEFGFDIPQLCIPVMVVEPKSNSTQTLLTDYIDLFPIMVIR